MPRFMIILLSLHTASIRAQNASHFAYGVCQSHRKFCDPLPPRLVSFSSDWFSPRRQSSKLLRLVLQTELVKTQSKLHTISRKYLDILGNSLAVIA